MEQREEKPIEYKPESRFRNSLAAKLFTVFSIVLIQTQYVAAGWGDTILNGIWDGLKGYIAPFAIMGVAIYFLPQLVPDDAPAYVKIVTGVVVVWIVIGAACMLGGGGSGTVGKKVQDLFGSFFSGAKGVVS